MRGQSSCGFALRHRDFLGVSVSPSGPQWVERFQSVSEAGGVRDLYDRSRFLGDSFPFQVLRGVGHGTGIAPCPLSSKAEAFQLALWDGALRAEPSGQRSTSHVRVGPGTTVVNGPHQSPLPTVASPEKLESPEAGDAWSGRF